MFFLEPNLLYYVFHVFEDRNEIHMASQLTGIYVYQLDYTEYGAHVEALPESELKVKFNCDPRGILVPAYFPI